MSLDSDARQEWADPQPDANPTAARHGAEYWLGYGFAAIGIGWALGWLLLSVALMLALLTR